MRDPIAVIGIGCRFPGGASSPRRLWDYLTQGKTAARPVPRDRWDHRRFYDPDPSKPGKTYVRQAGFLDEPIDAFDAAFFNISPREAAVLDPQQRMLAEVAWEGLEDAGLAPESLAGSPTGVYVGGFMLDSMLTHMGPMNRDLIGPHTAVGATMTVLSNRISYMFDFRGPSISLDTACSSSMVAVHLACQDLWSGDTNLGMAGGVNVMFRPEIFVAMSKGKFLSADGYSKGFDSRADGYGRGEGAALVVLKRAADALRDGDRVYALIRATGVNQDGHTESMTAPSSEAQEALIRRIYTNAKIDPTEVHAFEAHGTGTLVGDPAELGALGRVSKRSDDSGPWVGSLKANIGHLEAAAGVAGLIKACMCLQNRKLPPQANLIQANPKIPFAELGLRIPRQIEPLTSRHGEPLRIGVNSFGYGGTNAHALLEEAPARTAQPRTISPAPVPEGVWPLLLPISARSLDALRALAGRYAELLKAPDHAPLSDICFSAATRRGHHEHRLALVTTSDATEVATRLASFAGGNPAEDGASGRALPLAETKPVLVFTGMGPQWWAMGRELYKEDALFKSVLDECDVHFKRFAGWSLLAQMLEPDEASSNMPRADIAQPANMYVQLGLLAIYRRAGIEPAAVIGHSAGEVASAYAAGRYTIEQAVQVIYERSRIQAKAAGMGKMLAVGLSEEGARAAIKGREKLVSLAAINGPSAVTLSGDADAITAIAAELEAKGTFNRILKVEVPYHSPAMDALKPEVMQCLGKLQPSAGNLTIYSTVTGDKIEGVSFDAQYWCDNIREPTMFAKAVRSMLRDGHRLFLELGPHPVLSASIKECLAEAKVEGRTINSLKRMEPERKMVSKALCELYAAGTRIDFPRLYSANAHYTQLPSYPWQRERHWQESEEALIDRKGLGEHTLLGPRISAPTPTWERGLNAQFLPCLDDHRVRGTIVVPGATYVEMALGVRRALGLAEPHVLEDVRFEHAMVVTGNDEPVVRTTYDEATQTVSIYSHPRDARTAWTRHATAKVRRNLIAPPEEYVKLGDLDARAANWFDTERLYEMLKERGLDYGPKLRGVCWLLRGEGELLAGIQLPESEAIRTGNDTSISLDPTWLDPCLQAMVALLPDNDHRLFLPMGARSVRFSGILDPQQALFCHVRITKRTESTVEGEIALIDNGGRVVARLSGVECAALADQDDVSKQPAYNEWTYEHAFEESALEGAEKSGGWIVFADRGAITGELTKSLKDAVVVAPGPNYIQKNKTSFEVRPGSATDLEQLFAAIDTARYPNLAYLTGIVGGADKPSASGVSGETSALMRVALAFAAAKGKSLAVVTQDAQRAGPSDRVTGLSSAALIGLGRVIGAEIPSLSCRAIDVVPGTIEALALELKSENEETEVALRSGKRLVRRLRKKPISVWEEEQDALPQAAEASGERQVYELALDGSERRPRRATRSAPGKGEIEVEVDSATITRGTAIRGRRTAASPWPIELTGTVVSLGEGATGYSVGQRVQAILGHAPLAIGTHAQLRLGRDLITVGNAGGRMLPLLAAETALHAQARARAGERLLVLGNAGGIGVACLDLGRAAGAQVAIVLDPIEEKAPADVKVFDLRSTRLAEEILAWTGDSGVDVLVNAALDPEPTISAVLGSFGRFVDAGPLSAADGVFATAWAKGASCSRVDLQAMLQQRPKEAELRLVAALDRVPYSGQAGERWSMQKQAEALHWLSERSRQDGMARVTLSLSATEPLSLAAAANEPLFVPNATYLVTGGFGGFGLALARWMVAEGAQSLVLTGRKGASTPEAKELIADLERAGAKVHAASCDVASEADMRALFAKIQTEMPPLKGIFHTAGVLDDAPMVELDLPRIEKVVSPKVGGAVVMHHLTKELPLDFFVLFSSVSSLIGNPRQGNYVAANAFLDALAEQRQAAGLVGTSIQWGVLGEMGMAKEGAVKAYLESLGLHAMAPSSVLAATKRVLRLKPAEVGILDVSWEILGKGATHLGQSKRTAHLIGEGGKGAQSEAEQLRKHLRSLPPEARQTEVAVFLTARLAHILQLPAERVDKQKSLAALGVDSLLSMQVQVTIREALGIEIPALELLRAGSLEQVAGNLSSKLEVAAPVAEKPKEVETAEAQIDRQVDNMSESEVEAVLRAMLEAQENEASITP